jgi:hypothetical protein
MDASELFTQFGCTPEVKDALFVPAGQSTYPAIQVTTSQRDVALNCMSALC